MAFNNAELTNFFENGPQMALTNAARVRLAAEGLGTIEDFDDFKDDQLDVAVRNLRTSIPGVPATVDAAGNVLVPAIAPILPCLVPAKCILRLKVASTAYHYYKDTARTPTSANMNYTRVLKTFHTEWEAIIKQSKEDKPTVPVLSKSQTPVRWIESFKDCLFRTYGVRKTPLTYVIRDNIAVVPEATMPLLPTRAYSEEAGSVLNELIARLDHDNPLFKTDNNSVYSLLDEATRGTIYAPTIKPFARTKNGRAAWFAITNSHAGNDKWEQIEKEKTKFLLNNKWNGRQFGLDKFTNLHRTAYVALEEAALHVQFQLPNEHTRVGYLLDNIINSDPDLRAALASIRANVNGMRENFESAVAFMLPVCPYAKHSKKTNPNTAVISDATLLGKGSSKSGVDFRWHTKEEYQKLNKEQRDELFKWQRTKQGKAAMKAGRNNNKGSGGGGGNNNSNNNMTRKQLRAKIASLEQSIDTPEGGNGGTDDSSEVSGITLEQVKAMIAIATATNNLINKEDASKKREKIDEDPNVSAALAIQQILKRSRN